MLIARLEPENNIETILEGVTTSDCERTFLVIGNHNTAYGAYLKDRFGLCNKVRFIGSIYDMRILNNLRYFSNIYFHGHSVGGTNPSLLEAMSSNSYICANKNIFNFSILGNDATYFTNSAEVRQMVESMEKNSEEARFSIFNNHRKIRTTYSWDDINGQYIRFMIDAYKEKNFSQKGLDVFTPRTTFGRLAKNVQSPEERVRQLEEENARLKTMYADLSLIHNTYKEAVTKSMS
jgi:glycosyltransferase involved in cell wall biosynthesis